MKEVLITNLKDKDILLVEGTQDVGNWDAIGYLKDLTEGEIGVHAFLNILEKNGVLLVNPYPKYYVDKFTGNSIVRVDWQQAEEKIFRNPFILTRDKSNVSTRT